MTQTKTRIIITQSNPIEFDYLQKIVEAAKELGVPVIKTAVTWTGNYRIIIEWR